MPDILNNQRPDLEFVEIQRDSPSCLENLYVPASTAVTVQDGAFSLLPLSKKESIFQSTNPLYLWLSVWMMGLLV